MPPPLRIELIATTDPAERDRARDLVQDAVNRAVAVNADPASRFQDRAEARMDVAYAMLEAQRIIHAGTKLRFMTQPTREPNGDDG